MSLLLAQISGGGGSITGTLAATEAQDTSAFAGVRGHTGTLTATEAQDSASLTGKVGHTGTLAATEAQDVAAFSGKHGQTGTLAVTEAQDVAAFAGTVTGGGASITGTLAATEEQDSAAIVGEILQPISNWQNHWHNKTAKQRKEEEKERRIALGLLEPDEIKHVQELAAVAVTASATPNPGGAELLDAMEARIAFFEFVVSLHIEEQLAAQMWEQETKRIKRNRAAALLLLH